MTFYIRAAWMDTLTGTRMATERCISKSCIRPTTRLGLIMNPDFEQNAFSTFLRLRNNCLPMHFNCKRFLLFFTAFPIKRRKFSSHPTIGQITFIPKSLIKSHRTSSTFRDWKVLKNRPKPQLLYRKYFSIEIIVRTIFLNWRAMFCITIVITTKPRKLKAFKTERI